MTETRYKEGQDVWWVTKTWGEIPGSIFHVYTPEDTDENTDTRYTILLDADKCPEDFQPDRIAFAFADKLRSYRRPTNKSAAPAKKAPATKAPAKKKVTGRVYKEKEEKPPRVVGRAKVVSVQLEEGSELELTPEFISPEN